MWLCKGQAGLGAWVRDSLEVSHSCRRKKETCRKREESVLCAAACEKRSQLPGRSPLSEGTKMFTFI